MNSERITELREMKGWNKSQLAKEAGLSRSHITKLENGTTKGSWRALEKIAHALDVSIKEFL